MLGGWLWMVVFWGGLVALVVWGIRAATRPRGGEGEHRPSPLDIAKERYARGEISREQYEEMRRTLLA
jgi:putative membrane protein